MSKNPHILDNLVRARDLFRKGCQQGIEDYKSEAGDLLTDLLDSDVLASTNLEDGVSDIRVYLEEARESEDVDDEELVIEELSALIDAYTSSAS